jgi:pimeloyl-ACP methyl ester carboxylesterase
MSERFRGHGAGALRYRRKARGDLRTDLVIGGSRDRFYPTDLFREMAESIPNARLIIYEDHAHGGTLADRRFGRDVVALLFPRASFYNS